jgi:cysteinyl-tRNA synthetase
MDDDLGVPQAMAVVHNTVRAGNIALAAGDKETAAARLAETRAMLGVLGLDPLAEPWADEASGGAAADLRETVGKLVAVALEQRQAARARKDFAAADAIRAQLGAAGVQIEDTPAGPRWSLSRRASNLVVRRLPIERPASWQAVRAAASAGAATRLVRPARAR